MLMVIKYMKYTINKNEGEIGPRSNQTVIISNKRTVFKLESWNWTDATSYNLPFLSGPRYTQQRRTFCCAIWFQTALVKLEMKTGLTRLELKWRAVI